MGKSRAESLRRLAGVGIAAAATAAAGVGLVTPASAAEGRILGAGSATAIEGSYIVVMKDGPQAQGASADALAARHGGKIKHRFSATIKGFSATMSERQAKRLAADPAVAYVEADQVVSIAEDQLNPPSWGLDRIDQAALPLNNKYSFATRATNVNAYIIDTGILTTHQDFGGRAVHGRDTVDNDNNATDCNGHGTHVAGTVGGGAYGVAKGVKLYGVRVLNCSGSGTNAGVIAGVDWVTQNHVKPAVANMSLGGGASSALDDAVRRSISAGVTYALASGNSNANACNSSPARVTEALTVNASDRNDARASFSNYGTCTDLFAPGVSITSAWHTGSTATNTISGTSMASPHVAGAAALYLAANPSATPSQVNSAIINAATSGRISNPGTGSPNRLLFTGDGGGEEPPPTGCDPVTNGTDVTIPDAGSAVTSSITIADCDGGSASSTVSVDIRHTYRGDLVIDLIAPDGTSYRLKNSSGSDGADNVIATYTVNLAGETANGTWRLSVRDVYRADTGYINTWTLDL
ncbi:MULTISPECIES: S8 family peptidase [Actinokineospora]|uniref:Serine protease n=1 Tax=Actinokineospora fastidiosa TaxID=1816 RepID=A0A918LAE3_9PSEU|nr:MULTISPECIES: S8 family peptidase [Actinokineospora]UVS82137.1 Extracellular serine proteinase precursor [Actinokineospora sp. UTMC 2448]GGS23313.1 serine protease [Actinokineospora fastidiosa]